MVYADDAAGAGKLKSIKQWWETIKEHAPMYGCYPKPSKSFPTCRGNGLPVGNLKAG